jgi:hypothetical protein
MLKRRLKEISAARKRGIAFFLLFAVILLSAACSKSPEGHKAEIEQKGIPLLK